MQDTTTGQAFWPVWRAIGALQAQVRALERAAERKHKSKGGAALWKHLIAMGTIMALSILGHLDPGAAKALVLKTLVRALGL